MQYEVGTAKNLIRRNKFAKIAVAAGTFPGFDIDV